MTTAICRHGIDRARYTCKPCNDLAPIAPAMTVAVAAREFLDAMIASGSWDTRTIDRVKEVILPMLDGQPEGESP